MSIEYRVKKLIADQFGFDVEELKLEYTYAEDIMAESVEIVELIAAMEEEFDIEIPDEEAEKNVTVGQTIDYIKEKLKAKKHAD